MPLIAPKVRSRNAVAAATDAPRNIVRKSEFAALCNVSPGRVTQWITEGKIRGAALVGSGRSAQIDFSVAQAQLRETLDVDMRFGMNGLNTRLDASPPPPKPRRPEREGEPDQLTLPLSDATVEAQIKAEKLRHAQLMTSRLEEEDRARRGVYIEAIAARAEMMRLAADLLKSFEGALPDFAAALASKFETPSRDVLHLLRGEFRRVRERLAKAHALDAGNEPKTYEAEGDRDQNSIQ